MPGKAFSFGFSIGASLAPSVGASFMKVNKGLYAMKGGHVGPAAGPKRSQ